MEPLRRLLWGKETPRPPFKSRFFGYVAPIGLLALIGLGLATGAYLQSNRDLNNALVVLLAAGSVAPAALAWRRPVLAWRVALLTMVLGVWGAVRAEAWPWNPVQIFVVLFVLGRLASTQATAVTAWATGLSLIPVFAFADAKNVWGAAVLVVAVAAIGNIVVRTRGTRELVELTELERARRTVLEERARIAREMHDVVAHHMSMIAVRAETAPYRVEGLPDSAREELATIATAARAALTDMRRLLGALRSEVQDAPTAPQPGLDDVDALVTTARAAGLRIDVRERRTGEVPGTVGLTAYRIVQEALANAARHAPDGRVTLDVRGLDDGLRVTIRNPLPSDAPAAKGGHGLAGMRERVLLLGGTLVAGPHEGEFLVEANLPYGGPEPAPDA